VGISLFWWEAGLLARRCTWIPDVDFLRATASTGMSMGTTLTEYLCERAWYLSSVTFST
jgi:hypothetical protein